ncbi:MAG: RloB family protein [Flavobacterium sp.]
MAQDFRKTILLVCEGQRSEPDYFHNLRNEVLTKIHDVSIDILPIPKDEQEAIDKEVENYKIRKGAKKRTVRAAINQAEPVDYIIEDEYKSQPTCYVRKAQLAYFEKGYSEIWAIYDKDGHPDHAKAYSLSISKNACEKIVNIGFSSISFEEWILMHFEYCEIEFLKSQCRDNDKKSFDCGTETNENDCNGEKCVVGRIVSKQFLNYNNSKFFNYNDYNAGLHLALINALKCRETAKDKVNFYNNNPYVSLDRIVFKLKNIEKGDFNWVYESYFEIDTNIFINIRTQSNITDIMIENRSNITFIAQKESIKLILSDFTTIWSNERKILNAQESFSILKQKNVSLSDFHYAIFKIHENDYKILDVVQIKNFI